MLQFFVVLVAFFIVLAIAATIIALIVSAIVLLAVGCLIGLPIWLMARRWMQQRGLQRPAQRSIDRLRALYVDGKIDLFEFERRVAKLVAVEQ
jgi:uncharacterized membrane protein